ncbi:MULTISPECIES: fimbrial protein [unclassified Raoultella]|uniref:fimbrial protein n=1 Tax=unclassified Raoultella TaxID=2627600 RepID=UPI00135AA381|nr:MULTISPECIES: fimbrial protein [unclassified Raoultella]
MKSIMRIVAPYLLAFCGMCGFARADGTWVDCARTNGYYQYFDSATVQVGKDADVGDFLGSWFTSSNPTAWTCNHRTAYQSSNIPIAVQGYPPYTIWGSAQIDGQTYTIYNTVVKAGLGYVARWRYTIKGQVSDWYPLTVNNGVYQTPAQLFNASYSGSSWNVGVDVQVRFVKTSTSLTAGSLSIFDPMYMRHYQSYQGSTSLGGGTYMIAQFRSGGLVISTTGGTCTTPDIAVELPPAGRAGFRGIGYTTSRTGFNLDFKKCSAGLASISYLFTPKSSIIDNTQGVFALDSTSTASGVGIQLLNGQDIPLSFNTEYLLSDYDTTRNDANYSVPLRAGLYQTENNVTSGSINGAVVFTVRYR